MNSDHRLRRVRFSLRTIAIVVTLVCAYFGAWEVTKKYGVANETKIVSVYIDGEEVQGLIDPLTTEHSPAPFVVYREYQGYGEWRGTYLLWFFGIKVALLKT